MRTIVLALSLLASSAVAQDIVIRSRGPVIVSAQEHAEVIAARGSLIHSRCNAVEGIGMGSTPEAARRNCCYFGRRVIIEEGVAYSPARRQWFAVIRYR